MKSLKAQGSSDRKREIQSLTGNLSGMGLRWPYFLVLEIRPFDFIGPRKAQKRIKNRK